MKLRYKRPFFNWLAQLFQKVSGIPPLTMPRAVAGGLKEVTAYGGCALNGIPSEYTELEYLESNDKLCNIDLDFKGHCTVYLDCQGMLQDGLSQIIISCGEQAPSYFGKYGNSTYYCMSSAANGLASRSLFVNRNNVVIYFNKGSDAGFDIDGISYRYSGSRDPDIANSNFCLFSSPAKSYGSVARIYSCKIYQNNFVIRDLVPCKRKSDNELGMYDRVSHRFFTNSGTGTFTAGNPVTPSPDKPCEIWCNNGIIKPGPANLTNYGDDSWHEGYWSANGLITPSSWTRAQKYSDTYIAVNSSVSYIFSVKFPTARTDDYPFWVALATYNANKTFLARVIGSSTEPSTTYSTTFTFNSNVAYVRLSFRTYGDAYDVKFTDAVSTFHVEGTQETITVGNNSANAEMLLKTINYNLDFVDEQDILNGIVTRNVGIKVFGGSESWARSGEYNNRARFQTWKLPVYSYSGISKIYCSHFISPGGGGTISCWIYKGYVWFDYYIETTLADWKQFLADQYNAGTPVIVVYPLATPVTEQVEPQALDTVAGTNTLEITQASIAGLELKAEYKRH